MDFNEIHPNELINLDWFDNYQKEITALWWQLVQLNNNLFIMEHIAAFPFGLLTGRTPFWLFVYGGLFEVNIMIVWRLVDPKENTLTLISLKILSGRTYVEKNIAHNLRAFCKTFILMTKW